MIFYSCRPSLPHSRPPLTQPPYSLATSAGHCCRRSVAVAPLSLPLPLSISHLRPSLLNPKPPECPVVGSAVVGPTQAARGQIHATHGRISPLPLSDLCSPSPLPLWLPLVPSWWASCHDRFVLALVVERSRHYCYPGGWPWLMLRSRQWGGAMPAAGGLTLLGWILMAKGGPLDCHMWSAGNRTLVDVGFFDLMSHGYLGCFGVTYLWEEMGVLAKVVYPLVGR